MAVLPATQARVPAPLGSLVPTYPAASGDVTPTEAEGQALVAVIDAGLVLPPALPTAGVAAGMGRPRFGATHHVPVRPIRRDATPASSGASVREVGPATGDSWEGGLPTSRRKGKGPPRRENERLQGGRVARGDADWSWY